MIDVGGTGIKALVLDPAGKPLTDRHRIATPKPATPRAVLRVIGQLAAAVGEYERISIGFPGVVKSGVIHTAPNLHRDWNGYSLERELEQALGAPARVANDSGIQGYGAITGRGVEMVITLGTGLGASLFVDGVRLPNLELAHHPFRKGDSYEQQLGVVALDKIGKRKWNERLAEAIELLARTFNYDRLYIGGGNAEKVTLQLPANVTLVPNLAGLLGGIAIWRS